MKKTSVFLIFLIAFSASIVIAADEGKTGRISGTMMIKDGGPMADGTVLFFSAALGPPPVEKKYMRSAENIAVTDNAGKFSAVLPEGKYYIGGMKHITERWGGPPREGDIFVISKDEDGAPKSYLIKNGSRIDIGAVTDAAPYKETIATEGITAFEGTVRDMYGNPAKDVVVFAYVTSAMDEGLAFVSGYTDMDGRYMLRVHKGGTFYLMVMGDFGAVFPASGMTVSNDGKESSAGLTVKTGEIKKIIDIKLPVPLLK
jgi:hypothetical protein